MTLLKCDIDEQLFVTVNPLSNDGEGESALASSTLSLRLSSKDNEEFFIATKVVPWPANEALPTEIKYDDTDGFISLKSTTTEANIPFRPRIAKQVGIRADNSQAKRFSSFSANPVTLNDGSTIISALITFAENPNNTKNWKAVKKATTSNEIDLTGRISHSVQTALVSALHKRSSKETEFTDVCEALQKSNVFGFRCLDQFFSLLLDTEQSILVISAMKELSAVPETIYAKVLAMAARSESEKKGKKILCSLLKRSFTDKFLTEAVTSLSSEEAATLLEWCTQLYQMEKHSEFHVRILTLIGVLLDSQGHRLVWDAASHEKVLSAAGVLADMAALADSFSTLDSLCSVPDLLSGLNQDRKPYQIRRVKLEPVKIGTA